MKRNISIWDIFYKLPEKRQKRLQHKMDMEIEIDFQEITIVRETEYSIMAMVPCMSGDITKNLYIEYFFESKMVEFVHTMYNESLWTKLKLSIAYLLGYNSTLGQIPTMLEVEQVEQIIDFLCSIVEDIRSSKSSDSSDD